MKSVIRLSIMFMSFMFVESFIKPMLLSTRPNLLKLNAMAKHSFVDISSSLSVPDKYFIICSLVDHVVMKKPNMLYDYCYKNLNYTNVMHITLSSDLEYVINKHWHSKSTLDLFDTIQENAKLTDCYMHVYTLDSIHNATK